MTPITHPKLLALKEYFEIKYTRSLWGLQYWSALQLCPDSYYHSIGEPLPQPFLITIPTPTFDEWYYNVYAPMEDAKKVLDLMANTPPVTVLDNRPIDKNICKL